MKCSMLKIAALGIATWLSAGCVKDKQVRDDPGTSAAEITAAAMRDDVSKDPALGEEKPTEVKNFFKKGSRLSGALTSEGAEIERSLGVN